MEVVSEKCFGELIASDDNTRKSDEIIFKKSLPQFCFHLSLTELILFCLFFDG